MEWSEKHDAILYREILLSQQFNYKPRTVERGKGWEEIDERLNSINDPKFKVSKRSVREHFQLLILKFKTKRRSEERASGIKVVKDNEVDKAMEEIYEKSEAAEEEQVTGSENKKRKVEMDKPSAEEVRLRAAEKLSKTNQRTNIEEGLVKPKKARQSGGETVQFLREKSERDYQIRQEQLRMRQKEHENPQNMQQQQLKMMRIMQQQNNTMMPIMSKLVNK